jgi:hypothetical protein
MQKTLYFIGILSILRVSLNKAKQDESVQQTPTHPSHSQTCWSLKMINFSLNNAPSFDNSCLSQPIDPNQTAKPQSILPPEVLNALDTIQGLNLKIEICGSWVWVFGADVSHEATLRAANFNWSSKRGCWYFCPAKDRQSDKPHPNRQPWNMDKIREKYGSQIVKV